MLKRYKSRLIYVVLILTMTLLSSLFFGPLSFSQTMRSFEAKADADLKAVYQAYAGQLRGAGLSAARRREREALKNRIRLEERLTGTAVGVIIALREDSAAAEAELERRGFHLRARIGNIAVTTVSVDDLPRLAEVEVVEALSGAGYGSSGAPRGATNRYTSLRAFNDAANAAVRASEARATYNLTGRGVVVALIDSGIDWGHGDFRKADGSTRIKALWDMSDAARTGPGNVGRTYTEAEINAALQNGSGVDQKDLNGHGTHVTGTAAGNGLGTGGGIPAGTFAGIAPEADLVIVKGTRNTNNQAFYAWDDVIAALAYIRDQAALLNEPFVINLSVRGHFSQRDGSHFLEVAIDNLLSGGPGREMVLIAGNEADRRNHAGGVIAQGEEITIPFTINNLAGTLTAIYSNVDALSAKVIKPDNTVVGPVSFNNSIASDPDITLGNLTSNLGAGAREIFVTFKNRPPGNWRLVLSGEQVTNGRYDVWNAETFGNGIQFDAAVADGLSSLGIPSAAKKAVTVANFVSKTQYVDLNGITQIRTGQGAVGQGAVSSSTGPSRDGRLKPEIAAPGSYLLSTRSADFNVASGNLANDGGRHSSNFGTSMAAPVVTGTIALMLQANRNLTSDQIKRLLLRTVTNDSFTGSSVSYKYGYGKLNALAAVKAVVDNVAASEFVSVSAASFAADLVAAPESIVAGFGAGLAPGSEAAASTPLPTSLAGVSVRITDSAGDARLAGLFFVSPTQINYAVPTGAASGVAQVDVLRDGSVVASGALSINNVWPALFTANASGGGMGAAVVLRFKADGQQVYESALNPIDLSIAGDRVFLILYGTAIRGRSDLSKVKIYLGGTSLTPLFAEAQGSLVGLDQINIELPNNLAGRGRLDLVMYVDGWAANVVQFTIK